jgi:hypothetical protein
LLLYFLQPLFLKSNLHLFLPLFLTNSKRLTYFKGQRLYWGS